MPSTSGRSQAYSSPSSPTPPAKGGTCDALQWTFGQFPMDVIGTGSHLYLPLPVMTCTSNALSRLETVKVFYVDAQEMKAAARAGAGALPKATSMAATVVTNAMRTSALALTSGSKVEACAWNPGARMSYVVTQNIPLSNRRQRQRGGPRG